MATDGVVVLPLFSTESDVGGGTIVLPSFGVITDGAAVSLPIFTLDGVTFLGAGSVELPIFSISTEAEAGEIGTASISFPMFKASAKQGIVGRAALELPIITLSATAGPTPTITATISLPLIQVVASGYNPPSANTPDTDVGSTYNVYVANARTKRHSQYDNFLFNSFGEFLGSNYACGSDGIYLLTGDDDDGVDISCSLIWAMTDFGSSRVKWVDAAYLHIRGDTGALEVWANVDERTQRIYTVDLNQSPQGMHVRRALFGRGLFGTWWSVGVKKDTSTPLTVSDIELRAVTRQRRLR